jgi:hypothetical protein
MSYKEGGLYSKPLKIVTSKALHFHHEVHEVRLKIREMNKFRQKD